MTWLVACTNRRCLRTDSQKDIEEIIKSKLATIVEEPELYDQDLNTPTIKHRQNKARRVKELRSRFKRSRLFLISRFSLRDSYIHFMAGFVAKDQMILTLAHCDAAAEPRSCLMDTDLCVNAFH
ncbi:hypothetical protein Ancab_015152 [Ancistrocladus abbreviatus]